MKVDEELSRKLGITVVVDENCTNTVFFMAKKDIRETEAEWLKRCGAISNIGQPESASTK